MSIPVQPGALATSWQERTRVLESAEPASFESLVREHSRFVFKVAYGVLRNSHDAEDVVQEVFLRVHRSGTSDIQDMRAWLARSAFRLSLDRIRRQPMQDVADLDLATADPGADHLAMQRQQVAQLQRLIAALPAELRHPLVLSALEELNSRQIAEVLGINESSVRNRIMRARQVLKEKLTALTEAKR